MTKNRINKNDRKRQRRKDFQHGRDWHTTPQDQRSSYPKSNLALRADADRRAEIAGIRTKLPTASWRTINTIIDPNPGVDMAAYYQHIKRSLARNNLFVATRHFQPPIFIGMDAATPTRPALKREMKVGEILAYRCWRLDAPLLRSVYIRDVWYPREIMTGRGIEDWSERGVHAWKDLNSSEFNNYIREYLAVSSDPWCVPITPTPAIIVTGTVLLWGDVVEHEHGYRAEFAKINSIDWLYPNAKLMGREREALAQLRELYGVS